MGANVKLINIAVNNGKVSCRIDIGNVYLLLIFFFIVEQFRRLLELMNNHWELFNSESERHTLKYYANIGRKVTNYFAGIGKISF